MIEEGLIIGKDKICRCSWCGKDPEYIRYHDEEWGRPVTDDNRLFEKICLEGFQAGLSWLTILRKRENFRRVFSNFDFVQISHYGEADVQRLLDDSGIVRHRGKIESVINNAKRAIELKKECGSLAHFFWQYEPDEKERPHCFDYATLMSITKTETSTRLSKDLKARGWSYVGPTTVYAFMQAMGMVNDHLQGCAMRDEIEVIRGKFIRPSHS